MNKGELSYVPRDADITAALYKALNEAKEALNKPMVFYALLPNERTNRAEVVDWPATLIATPFPEELWANRGGGAELYCTVCTVGQKGQSGRDESEYSLATDSKHYWIRPNQWRLMTDELYELHRLERELGDSNSLFGTTVWNPKAAKESLEEELKYWKSKARIL